MTKRSRIKVNLTMSVELKEKLQEEAGMAGMPMSSYMVSVLANHVRQIQEIRPRIIDQLVKESGITMAELLRKEVKRDG